MTFKDIADNIRSDRERRNFQEAVVGGGHKVYLDTSDLSRMGIRPLFIPFRIDVTSAVFRSQSGKREETNSTREAVRKFNNLLEGQWRVRIGHFGREEFGLKDDFAPGEKKVLDVLYRCLDDRGKVVSEKQAFAREMERVKLSCRDGVPSVFASLRG
jgi:hypothetical protein